MRMFLPIKGPGGRYLTPREKVALLILGLTLVLCLLTLLAGESAFYGDGARNPVFGFVAWLCRTLGGGVIALYGLVLVWSGLIYFKGERVAVIGPLPPRMFAAICVTIGVSGALGIAHLETAGGLGLTVGLALGNTLGAGVGFPILILLMLLGVHLAGQGAWVAIREPALAGVPPGGPTAPSGSLGGGFGLQEASEDRFQAPPLPDDGDPSPAERTAAVTRAMEEIERSQGVRIVDVEREEAEGPGEEDEETRASIGEEVEAAPPPPTETEEAEVQRGLEAVRDALTEPAEDDDEESHHGLVPVPAEDAADEDEANRYVAVDDEDGQEEDHDEAEPGADALLEEEEEEEEEQQQPDDPGDPYAKGGLLRRLSGADGKGAAPESDRPYTSFDWRGRPLDG